MTKINLMISNKNVGFEFIVNSYLIFIKSLKLNSMVLYSFHMIKNQVRGRLVTIINTAVTKTQTS